MQEIIPGHSRTDGNELRVTDTEEQLASICELQGENRWTHFHRSCLSEASCLCLASEPRNLGIPLFSSRPRGEETVTWCRGMQGLLSGLRAHTVPLELCLAVLKPVGRFYMLSTSLQVVVGPAKAQHVSELSFHGLNCANVCIVAWLSLRSSGQLLDSGAWALERGRRDLESSLRLACHSLLVTRAPFQCPCLPVKISRPFALHLKS